MRHASPATNSTYATQGVSKQSQAIGPLARQGIHFPAGNKKGNVGHTKREVIDTLPVAERLLDAATPFNKVTGKELALGLRVK